ncbi:SEF1 [Candida pseudojiufengensis]|uniref:SEF1 n=1 Tax=Candida pseudojiufengensis TaxID=497109 RepID=UPI002223F448|nr:SEF1 [Candida pseudojiufengensis]KAI5966748.1 SEF1 [Candida pseudojiufengensis]
MKYQEKAKVKILPKPIAPTSQVSSPLVQVSPSLSTSSPGPSLTNRKRAKSTTNTNSTSNNDLRKQRKTNTASPLDLNQPSSVSSTPKPSKQTGHRPVTSCTFCRQHKIKCNASDNYPNPCQRCDRMGLKCEIDPQFRPKKGSQIQSLKSDVDELKAKIEMLTKNESLLTQALNQHNLNFYPTTSPNLQPQQHQQYPPQPHRSNSYPVSAQTPIGSPSVFSQSAHISPMASVTSIQQNPSLMNENSDNSPSALNTPDQKEEYLQPISEFILGDVNLPLAKANELHDRFMKKHLDFLPIIISRSATELYHKSNLLFWAVILTASLGEPEPTLYMSLASLIKQLAIETCWIKTPRSTHVIQALIILSIWPLPNEKVLDDCSYRFVGLAKNLSLQLGLHRGGEFIQEFSRNQVSLGPDAERWRTRSWLALFFCEQFWSSLLGLPPSINTTDYLLENARVDQSLPKQFRCLISLSIFQCKLVNVMGISVTRPDGLLEPSNRAGSLNLLDRELERLRFKLQIVDGSPIEVYYLYLKLMICCFAFLPGTPIEDQVKYVSSAYLSATRIITIVSQMNNDISLIELPIYVRQAVTYSVLLLFKLHLSKYLIDKYVDSARQSIVTVHRLFRNTLSSWKDLQNDISRTAKVLENLNLTLYTYPDIFIKEDESTSIISRMRSHLTASLFYDLVWCVHEGRRRAQLGKENKVKQEEGNDKKLLPLPFYNQITKDDFRTITTTTPNGTTITTLVPTDAAMNNARSNATDNKPLEINGIPLPLLDATGARDGINGAQSFINQQNLPPQDQQQQNQMFSNQQPPTPMHQGSPPMLDFNSQMTPQLPSQMHSIQHFQLPNVNMNNGSPQQPPQNQQQNYLPTISENPMIQFNDFFLQQSSIDQDDDFLGWFDSNMLNQQ